MADLEFDAFEGEHARPNADQRLARAKQVVNLTGAACSVALILGLGFWGYQLAVRDVTGVPVMRALTGPMRMAPVDPGGDQASNQGLSVNAIAASGTSEPLAEKIVLAPRPIELQPGDMAAATEVTSGAVPLSSEPGLGGGVKITGLAEPGTPADGEASLTEAAPEAPEPTEVVALAAPGDGAAVARSLRPQARPATLTSAAKSSDESPTDAAAPAIEIDPASLAAGTRLAQLGAFDTPDEAREKFAELQAEFGDLMLGKAPVIQSATSGGRTFYRLRAHGFEGEDDTRRFCAALEAQQTDCIPVAQR